MKQIYTIVCVALTCTFLSLSSQAQTYPSCNNTYAFPTQNNGGCILVVTNGLPNANISVYDGADRINVTEAQTDASGFGYVSYECGRDIDNVILVTESLTACHIPAENISAPASLPIKLSSFQANITGSNTATLKWTSDFELNSSAYEVQKSNDGQTFATIGTVAAAGNSMNAIAYDFDDTQLGSGAVFYRLKMVDIDGYTEYSKVVYVNNGTATSRLSVFPNPFQSDIQLVGISAADINTKNIHIYSLTGKEIGYRITGSNAISIDANVTPGIYLLKVKDQAFKLIKK